MVTFVPNLLPAAPITAAELIQEGRPTLHIPKLDPASSPVPPGGGDGSNVYAIEFVVQDFGEEEDGGAAKREVAGGPAAEVTTRPVSYVFAGSDEAAAVVNAEERGGPEGIGGAGVDAAGEEQVRGRSPQPPQPPLQNVNNVFDPSRDTDSGCSVTTCSDNADQDLFHRQQQQQHLFQQRHLQQQQPQRQEQQQRIGLAQNKRAPPPPLFPSPSLSSDELDMAFAPSGGGSSSGHQEAVLSGLQKMSEGAGEGDEGPWDKVSFPERGLVERVDYVGHHGVYGEFVEGQQEGVSVF